MQQCLNFEVWRLFNGLLLLFYYLALSSSSPSPLHYLVQNIKNKIKKGPNFHTSNPLSYCGCKFFLVSYSCAALFVNGVPFSEVFVVGFTSFCSHSWAPWKHFQSNTSFQLSKEIVQLSFELHNVNSSTKAYLNPTMSQQLSEQSSKIYPILEVNEFHFLFQ